MRATITILKKRLFISELIIILLVGSIIVGFATNIIFWNINDARSKKDEEEFSFLTVIDTVTIKMLPEVDLTHVKSLLDKGYSLAISSEKKTAGKGDDISIGVGIFNKRELTTEFMLQARLVSTVREEHLAAMNANEWVQSTIGPFILSPGEKTVSHIEFSLPKDASSGEYGFDIDACYKDITNDVVDETCNSVYNRKYSISKKFYLTVE